MNYEETVSYIKDFFERDLGIIVRDRKKQDDLKKCVALVESQISLMKSDIKPPQVDFDIIKNGIRSALNLLNYTPQTQSSLKFFNCFGSLLLNWNNNGPQNSQLETDATTIVRLSASHMTINESINKLNNLIMHVERLQKYNPPAYELAGHYLKSLDK